MLKSTFLIILFLNLFSLFLCFNPNQNKGKEYEDFASLKAQRQLEMQERLSKLRNFMEDVPNFEDEFKNREKGNRNQNPNDFIRRNNNKNNNNNIYSDSEFSDKDISFMDENDKNFNNIQNRMKERLSKLQNLIEDEQSDVEQLVSDFEKPFSEFGQMFDKNDDYRKQFSDIENIRKERLQSMNSFNEYNNNNNNNNNDMNKVKNEILQNINCFEEALDVLITAYRMTPNELRPGKVRRTLRSIPAENVEILSELLDLFRTEDTQYQQFQNQTNFVHEMQNYLLGPNDYENQTDINDFLFGSFNNQ
eukprot:TRINITY_DN193_c0_g4_i2.p1 TRINITY_DN193_c0_g4~~TRINITY_DN193_c0_g4_i2.p1  ORF type:complete len:306 (+),score=125.38 TRINITY_DN193_c0_g4_i2:65-982(+)